MQKARGSRASRFGSGPVTAQIGTALGVLVVFGALGCASGSDDDDRARTGTVEVPGEVGSHVWRATSASVTLDTHWSYDSLGQPGVMPSSGSTSMTHLRAELSPGALGRLEGLKLIPLEDQCTADGYRYNVLTITDADGTSATYADTGCNYLRVEGATVMLSSADVQQLMLEGD